MNSVILKWKQKIRNVCHLSQNFSICFIGPTRFQLSIVIECIVMLQACGSELSESADQSVSDTCHWKLTQSDSQCQCVSMPLWLSPVTPDWQCIALSHVSVMSPATVTIIYCLPNCIHINCLWIYAFKYQCSLSGMCQMHDHLLQVPQKHNACMT